MPNGSSVFDENNLTCTNTPVPEAGADNHPPISGDDSTWSSVEDQAFCAAPNPGREQTLVSSADQTVRVQGNQYTTVQEEIVTKTETNQIYIEAATEITLVVGASRLYMNKDGTIELTGINIKSDASTQNTIIGGMVDINP